VHPQYGTNVVGARDFIEKHGTQALQDHLAKERATHEEKIRLQQIAADTVWYEKAAKDRAELQARRAVQRTE
jgi:hypothetical protein